MPKKVKARRWDTLCTIAARSGGFLNCDALRAEGANASIIDSILAEGKLVTVPDLRKKEQGKPPEQVHKFKAKAVPVPQIRFVHGSPNLPYPKDRPLHWLGVSWYPTDKGGKSPTDVGGAQEYPSLPALPGGYGHDADGHQDPRTFKVEIVDPHATADTIKVKLEALSPVYKPDGSIDSHQPFKSTVAAHAKRSITVECERVAAGKKCFRSRYMRLVVDEGDFDTVGSKQALLVGPLADGSDGDDDKIEILDQLVRAEYELSGCKAGSKKCTLRVEAPVGDARARKRARVAVHVLRKSRGGAGVVTTTVARAKALNTIRELYAQADMSVELVDPYVRYVEPPANLISVGDPDPRRADGGKAIEVRIRVDGKIDKNVSLTTTKGATPLTTAKALAAAIEKASGVDAEASVNTRTSGKRRGSADVVVGDPQTQDVKIDVVKSEDRQKVAVAVVTGGNVDGLEAKHWPAGPAEQRAMTKNFKSGADRIDLFLVEGLPKSTGSGPLGQAIPPVRGGKRRPRANYRDSVFVISDPVKKANHFHTTIPHELGHVLMDGSHSVAPSTEMMGPGSPAGSAERSVHAPKRVGDTSVVPGVVEYWVLFSNPPRKVKGNPRRRLRGRNRGVLGKW